MRFKIAIHVHINYMSDDILHKLKWIKKFLERETLDSLSLGKPNAKQYFIWTGN